MIRRDECALIKTPHVQALSEERAVPRGYFMLIYERVFPGERRAERSLQNRSGRNNNGLHKSTR